MNGKKVSIRDWLHHASSFTLIFDHHSLSVRCFQIRQRAGEACKVDRVPLEIDTIIN